MKTIVDFVIRKETEKATLFEISIEGEPTPIWLPNSKFEIIDDAIEIEEDYWKSKLEELENAPENSTIIHIDKSNVVPTDKSYKLILSAQLKKLSITPFLFLPKSLVLDEGNLDSDLFDYFVKVPTWLWDKQLNSVINSQLDFYNSEEKRFGKGDFKLHNTTEEL